MHPNYWKFQNRNVQTFGFVCHDTNGLNHGPVWKTQSFLLSEICTVILWQDCYGKGNLRKSYCSTVGRRFPIGNAYSYTVKKCYSYLCMWMTSNWLERNKTLIRCGKYSIKKSIWENQHLSLIMYTWAALKDNVKKYGVVHFTSNCLPIHFGLLWTFSVFHSYEYPRFEQSLWNNRTAGVSSRNCTVTIRSRSTRAYSFICTSPVAVSRLWGFGPLSKYQLYLSQNLLCSALCIEAPESITTIRYSVSLAPSLVNKT